MNFAMWFSPHPTLSAHTPALLYYLHPCKHPCGEVYSLQKPIFGVVQQFIVKAVITNQESLKCHHLHTKLNESPDQKPSPEGEGWVRGNLKYFS